jgi:hypothetical protein
MFHVEHFALQGRKRPKRRGAVDLDFAALEMTLQVRRLLTLFN